MMLIIKGLSIGVEIRKCHLRVNDRLAILIWLLGGIDIIVQELRRLNRLLRVLTRRMLQVLRRIWTVMRRLVAHRPGTQWMVIESLLANNDGPVGSGRVFIFVVVKRSPSFQLRRNCRAVRPIITCYRVSL